ncbi:MAG: flagellar basal body rod protein FlgB [Clostridia bacterium]|nr:flagellar basal body rod protein FlgB [Clostridia bacterium]
MLDRIFSRTKMLGKALDATWKRNEAISQNIANVDTPGYKRKTVAFEEYLSEALDSSAFKGFRSDPKHVPIGGRDVDEVNIDVSEDNSTLSMRLDGNNVDIESEMALMAKNSIQYNTLIQKISGEFKKIKSVIHEGRR